MNTSASRRDFLHRAGTAVGSALALGVRTAQPVEAAAVQSLSAPAAGATLTRARRLRLLLQRPGLVIAPEAYSVIAGKLAEAHGFDAIYIGGNMMSMTYLGVPDWGIITTPEMVEIAGRIAREVSIPAIVDADQAGETSLNVYRTVRLYESAGIAALHIEDSRNPKKMETWAGPGGPSTTELQPIEQMRERLQAAADARSDRDFVIIGRTVAEDPNAVIRRGVAFAEAGADVVMNSLTGMTAEQINRIAREVPVPVLGIGVPKTHLAGTLMKVNIHPNIVSSAALALCDTIFRELKENGEVSSRPPLAPDMLTRITGANTYSELAKKWLTTPSR
ncbi:MAG TPA: isocitrate lyase/PEP mutase family protein [Vicinamibacterales bacterium]